MRLKLFLPFILLTFFSSKAQNVDLSGGVIFESEPYLVIDPANPQHIVVAWMGTVPLAFTGIKVKTTFNGGTTWSAPVAIPHISSTYKSADVSMAFDHNGALYTCFIDHSDVPAAGGVYIVRSTDGGLSWGTPSQVIGINADGVKYPIDRPWLTIGHASGSAPDTLYVTTKPAPTVAPPNRPYFTRSWDNGSTWTPFKYIDTTGYLVGNIIQAPMAAPAVDSAGHFHCSYPSYYVPQSVYPRYYMASLIPGTASFTYSTPYTITGASALDTDAKAGQRLICDLSNNKHMALFTIQNLHGDIDIFCLESTDGGNVWTGPTRVNNDPVGNGKMQDMVWANFDEHGNIIAGWRDRRNAPGTGYQQPSEVWGAIKWADSANFSANFKISDTMAVYDSLYLAGPGNDFMNIAMAQDTMSAVWGDVRTGALNIWFQRRAMRTNTNVGIQNLVHEEVPFIKIYPNPANNLLNVEADGLQELDIHDFSGKAVLVKKHCTNREVVNIAKLPAGEYLIEVTTVTGKNSATFMKTN